MTSDPRRGAAEVFAAVLGAGLMAVGCNSVHDTSVPIKPLVTIHGHVDLSTLSRSRPDAPLIGALVWSAVPAVSPVCLQFDRPEIRAACPDPYGVFYDIREGAVEQVAPVGRDGTFTLDLYHLPKAEFSVGDGVTRIAYGTLIVLEDLDGNGQPRFVERAQPVEGGDRRDEGPPAPLSPNADRIVAASFWTLRAPQIRVVFREGGFVKDSAFYPLPGCDAPPAGFSILSAPPFSDAQPPAGGCTTSGIDSPVEVAALMPGEAEGFTCRSVQRSTRVREPRGDDPPFVDPGLGAKGPQPICFSHEIFAIVFPGVCGRVRAYALKGCDVDPLCKTPEWNQTAAPPSWWPCP